MVTKLVSKFSEKEELNWNDQSKTESVVEAPKTNASKNENADAMTASFVRKK